MAPLFRVYIYQLRKDECVFQITLDHLVADGWSFGLPIEELGTILETGGAEAVWNVTEHPAGQEPDNFGYVHRQREWLAEPGGGKQFAYWREALAEDYPALDLPADAPVGRAIWELPAERPLGVALEDLTDREAAQLLALLHERLVRAGLMPRRSMPDALAGTVRTFETALGTGYQPKSKYPGPVRLALLPDPRLDDETNGQQFAEAIRGWRDWAPNLEVWRGPGNHITALTPPCDSAGRLGAHRAAVSR